MTSDFARNWWVVLIRGMVAVIVGILALTNPAATLVVVVAFFAAYALVDGIVSIVAGLKVRREYHGWGWLLASGIAGVIVGVLTFLWPAVTAVALLYFMMAWLVVTGVFEVIAGITLRKEITGEWWLILGGVLSVLLGLFLMANPAVGALAVLWMLGIYAVVFGVVMMMVAFRLRSWRGRLDRPSPTA